MGTITTEFFRPNPDTGLLDPSTPEALNQRINAIKELFEDQDFQDLSEKNKMTSGTCSLILDKGRCFVVHQNEQKRVEIEIPQTTKKIYNQALYILTGKEPTQDPSPEDTSAAEEEEDSISLTDTEEEDSISLTDTEEEDSISPPDTEEPGDSSSPSNAEQTELLRQRILDYVLRHLYRISKMELWMYNNFQTLPTSFFLKDSQQIDSSLAQEDPFPSNSSLSLIVVPPYNSTSFYSHQKTENTPPSASYQDPWNGGVRNPRFLFSSNEPPFHKARYADPIHIEVVSENGEEEAEEATTNQASSTQLSRASPAASNKAMMKIWSTIYAVYLCNLQRAYQQAYNRIGQTSENQRKQKETAKWQANIDAVRLNNRDANHPISTDIQKTRTPQTAGLSATDQAGRSHSPFSPVGNAPQNGLPPNAILNSAQKALNFLKRLR